MQYNFNYTITLNVKFTDEEFALLDKAILESEYKRECEVGGFWNGVRNMRNFGDPLDYANQEVSLTFRQLDKLTKCLEPFINYLKDESAMILYYNISNTLHSVNHEYKILDLIRDEKFKYPLPF